MNRTFCISANHLFHRCLVVRVNDLGSVQKCLESVTAYSWELQAPLSLKKESGKAMIILGINHGDVRSWQNFQKPFFGTGKVKTVAPQKVRAKLFDSSGSR